jgi:hypothetical protein
MWSRCGRSRRGRCVPRGARRQDSWSRSTGAGGLVVDRLERDRPDPGPHRRDGVQVARADLGEHPAQTAGHRGEPLDVWGGGDRRRDHLPDDAADRAHLARLRDGRALPRRAAPDRPAPCVEHANPLLAPVALAAHHRRRRSTSGRRGTHRNLAATLMIASGVPLAVTSKMLRHSQVGITADLYGHLTREASQAAADGLAAVLDAAPAAERAMQPANTTVTSGPAGGVTMTASTDQRGAPEGIRTPNLLIRSQMLYPLSYGRVLFSCTPCRVRPGSRPRQRGGSGI